MAGSCVERASVVHIVFSSRFFDSKNKSLIFKFRFYRLILIKKDTGCS